MDRKEASFILANIDRRVCDDELNEALDVAIKALEQEPKTDTWSIKDVANTFKKHGLIVEQEPCEGVFEKLISQELIPDKIKNENVKLCKELKKARKEKKRWKKKYIELRDGKKSIELARIEDGLGLEPILYR